MGSRQWFHSANLHKAVIPSEVVVKVMVDKRMQLESCPAQHLSLWRNNRLRAFQW